jgi:hypothetical protein
MDSGAPKPDTFRFQDDIQTLKGHIQNTDATMIQIASLIGVSMTIQSDDTLIGVSMTIQSDDTLEAQKMSPIAALVAEGIPLIFPSSMTAIIQNIEQGISETVVLAARLEERSVMLQNMIKEFMESLKTIKPIHDAGNIKQQTNPGITGDRRHK